MCLTAVTAEQRANTSVDGVSPHSSSSKETEEKHFNWGPCCRLKEMKKDQVVGRYPSKSYGRGNVVTSQ